MFLQLLTISVTCLAVKGQMEIMNPNLNCPEKLPERTFRSECTPAAADLVFAIDGSASIFECYFEQGKELMVKTAAELNSVGLLGSGDMQSRIGVFQFGAADYPSFPFLDKYSDIIEGMNSVFYQNSSSTKVADSINWAVASKDYFGAGKRGSAKQVLVFLTDCLDNCSPAAEREAKANADKAGVELVIVTYTSYYGQECVQTLTGGDQSKHFLWKDFTSVAFATGCRSTCEGPEIMNPNPNYLEKIFSELSSPPSILKSDYCTPAAADLVFGMDGSASIHAQYFVKGKELIAISVAQLLTLNLLGSGDLQTRVGAFQFGRDDYETFPLLDYYDDIFQGLNGMIYQNSSSTKVADSIKWALSRKFFFGGAKRGSAKQVLVLVTDCLDNCSPAQEREAKSKADEAGVELVIVTYTSDYGKECVETLTGGDKSKHLLWKDVSGVASLTTDCKPKVPGILQSLSQAYHPRKINSVTKLY